MKIDPLERTIDLIKVHGADRLRALRVDYTAAEMDALPESVQKFGVEGNGMSMLSAGIAAELLMRLEDEFPGDTDTQQAVLGTLAVGLMFTIGASREMPPGLAAMGTAMSCPQHLMHEAFTPEEIYEINSVLAPDLADALSEKEVTD